ncbi:MAG: MFS transporter [Alphaproteobacteria bacterium]
MHLDQKKKFELRAWLIWACAAIFYGYQFAQRVSPSVMTDELMSSFSVECAALGAISAFYYNAYAFLQIPAGSLLDKFGPRKMLSLATLLCTLGSILFATATGISQASIGRLFIGAGSAFGFLSCLKIGTIWFSSEKLPLVVGLSLCIGTVGAVGGSAPLFHMVQTLGWQQTIWMLAIVGFCLFALVLLVVKDKPMADSRASKKVEQPEQSYSFLQSLEIILKKPQTWLISFHGILMYVPLSAFADMWGTKFLAEVYQIDRTVAAATSSIIYIGMGLGSPILPLLAHWLKGYKPILLIGSAGSILTFFSILYLTSMPLSMLSTTLFFFGFFLGGQILCFSMVCNINPREISATAGGFHNMICMLSGVIFIPLVGYLLDLFAETPGVYSVQNYTWALVTILGAMVAAFIITFWIKEVYSKPEELASGKKLATEKVS